MSANSVVDFKAVAQDLLELIWLGFHYARAPESVDDRERVARLWAGALKAGGSVYPPAIYAEALESYMASASAKGAPPMPGDILRHCRLVMERVERDPKRREALQRWRDERLGIQNAI